MNKMFKEKKTYYTVIGRKRLQNDKDKFDAVKVKFKNVTYAKKCIETLKQQKLDYNEYIIVKWSIEPIITIGNSIN